MYVMSDLGERDVKDTFTKKKTNETAPRCMLEKTSRASAFGGANPQIGYGIGPRGKARDAKHMTLRYYCD